MSFTFIALLTFLSIIVSTCSGVKRDCALIYPASGAVYRQLCVFQPGGLLDTTMLVIGPGSNAHHNMTYFEFWSNASPLLGPPSGGQIGLSRVPANESTQFDDHSNCNVVLDTAYLISTTNRNWIPQPDGAMSMQLLPNGDIGAVGEGVACTLTRLYGTDCQANFDQLQAFLATGVPPKKMPMNRQLACTI
jgi:hypothetical protein